MKLVDPNVMLAAILGAVADLKVDPQAAEPEALFEHTELYDSTQLDQAFADLGLYRDRVCLIVPLGETWQTSQRGNATISEATCRVAALIGDKDAGPGQTAVFGDAQTLGTVALKHRVLLALTGKPFGGVVLTPVEGDGLEIREDKPHPGPARKAWLQVFQAYAGSLRTVINHGLRSG